MKDLCVIKAGSKGVTLYLDPNCDYMDLVREICTKFMKNRSVFGNIEIVLELKGRELSQEEVLGIIESIELNSDVKVLLLREGDLVKEKNTSDLIHRFYYEKGMENAKIIKGDVNAGETVTCDYSLVIFGDVKEDAAVKSNCNVIVLGKIYGAVIAGDGENRDAYIISTFPESDEIIVGGIEDPKLFAKRGHSFFGKKENEFYSISVFRDELIMEPLKNGVIF